MFRRLKQFHKNKNKEKTGDAQAQSFCRVAIVFVFAEADLDLRVGVLPAGVFDLLAVVRESSLAAISSNINWRLLGVVDDVFDARLAERQGAEVAENVDVRFFEVVEERLVAILFLTLAGRMVFGPSHLATLGGLLVQLPEFDDRSWTESDFIVDQLEGVG
jgi:hypothetical protein